MTRAATFHRILAEKLIGIVRLDGASDFAAIARALHAGGMGCLEITLTTPGALDGIREISDSVPDVIIGAGTVLDAEAARRAIRAGARFLVAPTASLEVVGVAKAEGVVSIPGALTPSEIYNVWAAGADLVKVFPASVGGPDYIRSLRGPLPQIPLAPTGGVTVENAGEFLRAGAAALCVGGWLVPKDAVQKRQYGVLTERASMVVDAVRRAVS